MGHRENYHTNDLDMPSAQGFTLGGFSGLVTVIAAGGDVFGLVNLNDAPLAVTMLRVRFATTTAFSSAQSLIFKFHKVYAFTAIHTANATALQAHYQNQRADTLTRAKTAIATGDRIPLVEIAGAISTTAAMTGATYTAADDDEPECVAVGAGSTLPGIYEDYARWDGLPVFVLPKNTGIVGKCGLTMGTAGVGNLFVGVDGFRML